MKTNQKEGRVVHISTLLYAEGDTAFCGDRSNGTLADRDAAVLLDGEVWCEKCLNARKAANEERSCELFGRRNY